jgi:hypothetical protein
VVGIVTGEPVSQVPGFYPTLRRGRIYALECVKTTRAGTTNTLSVNGILAKSFEYYFLNK